MPSITMRRVLSGLAPDGDEAARALAKVKLGDRTRVKIIKPRSLPLHNRWWKLCEVIAQNSEQLASKEQASDMLKLLAGHCTAVSSAATGEIYFLPKSISFAEADEAEFQDVWRRAVHAVTEHILPGVTEVEIENEILNLIGASNWSA